MLLCIVGETARGKDTLVRELETFGLSSVVSYTTRPMRPNETNGKEHLFITPVDSQKMQKNREIAAYTKIGEYEYFTTKKQLKDKDIYVIDPKGIEFLKKEMPELDLKVIYVTCCDEVAKRRALSRGESLETIERRMQAEAKQFQQFAKEKQYDYKFDNSGDIQKLKSFAQDVVICSTLEDKGEDFEEDLER